MDLLPHGALPAVICFEEGCEVLITDIQLMCPNPACKHHTSWLPSRQFLQPGARPGVAHLQKSDLSRLAQLPCPLHPRHRLIPVCPQGHELWLAFQGGDHVVAIVGTFHSGKTTFLAAFEHRVRQAWGPTFHTVITLFPVEHEVIYERDVRSSYLQGMPPQKTWERQYFFFEIGGQNDCPPETWRLTFYDGPGDVFADPERAERELHYLVYAQQILFVLDPYLIPNLERSLPPLETEKAEAIQGRRATFALQLLAQVFRRCALYGQDEKVPVDLAIVIPKMDLLPDDPRLLSREQRVILFPEPSPGRTATLPQLQRASGLAEELLRGPLGAGELVDMAQLFFRQVGFFFTTAWGPDGPCPDPQPVGVENPFLWLMYQRNKKRA